MNKKEIEELIKFVSKAGVSEVSLETKEVKITIKNAVREQIVAPSTIVHQAPQVVHAAPAPVALVSSAPPTAAPAKEADDKKYHTIKSPMIGTFYRSSAPDKPNFVNVGDEIKSGQVICIIEAMKLFNEIESDITGRVVKIVVDNASPVEYDQALILVEPS